MTPESDIRSAQAVVGEEYEGFRADRFIADAMALFPRSQFSQHGVTITVNGQPAKLSRRVRSGESVVVAYHPVEPPSIQPEKVELDIVFEDDEVIVLNKAQGVVVHPAAGNWSGTIAQGLLYHLGRSMEESEGVRPGIVHRLDKGTSGILIAAKSPAAKEYLARQFRKRTVHKEYLALVRGVLPRSTGTVDDSIARDPHHRKRFAVAATGGKSALTEYRVLQHFDGYSLVLLHPVTGRTHQIRVHMQAKGCPVLGDPLYARRDKRFPNVTMMLHAYTLRIQLPSDGEEHTFTAPLPAGFREALQAISDLPLEENGFLRQLS